ncbi:sensor histidine kinase [Larkinella soli]|uniref:sensor histidine kinase n=1 Tax=Larkinella soli TaxID=1770527 RepID=UPI000FFB8FD7|nr:ATP-binding protein [Larkinella soli]
MSIAHFLAAFFLIRFLRTYLKTTAPNPHWEARLLTAQYVVIGLLCVEAVVEKESVTRWIWDAGMVGGLLYLRRQPEFVHLQNRILTAVGPYVAVAVVSDFLDATGLYRQLPVKSYFEMGTFFALVWMFAMWQYSNKQKKALDVERLKRLEEEKHSQELERLVAERTAMITRQKEELEQTLFELRQTQDQLIQREKMASLGELTAGIAHEIQNPLNFVNNFSEVSAELIGELEDERQKPDRDTGLEEEILTDLKQNLQKITHHGKRADAIVKGMLQHSRASSGQKEAADLNALADEYLRLAYHGLRAKDKTFNAQLITEFDPGLGKISLVRQDIGRVLLNLFTNAFYATEEKRRQQPDTYKPVVAVRTRQLPGAVEICVHDNGTGIPETVRQKIFQPFFTTKPSGQGTGLGLSLSFDIVTKGHGGELKVDTEEGEFTEFTIRLPV